MSSKVSICLALCLLSVSNAGEVVDDKTTEAVVKAAVQAETKLKASIADHKESKKKEEAVAKATTEVLEVIQAAAKEGEKYIQRDENGSVNSKAAAAAAAEVKVATIDGASGLDLPKEAADNTEKVVVAAGKTVADHPNDQVKAIADAITKIEKEENTSRKVDLKPKVKGIVARAKAAVSNLPELAEGAVVHGAKHVENDGQAIGAFAIVAVLGFILVTVGRAHAAQYENSPYMKQLRLIRKEFNQGEKNDLETQYEDFQDQELNELRR